ncbi:hypothetical protein [Zymobacter palmae]|nr:hypothetical protein [Zymobacter palmae]BBG29987.1 conserved PrkA cluster protein [Zymobacter palmae]
MSNWEELYAQCYKRAIEPRTRFLTTDPRTAVALAYEDGMRTQSMVDLYEAGKEGKKSRSVRAIESREKRAGTGADIHAEYHKIRRYVDGLLDTDPLRYAVIMTLAPVKESIRQACKGEVYDMLHTRVRMELAERGERVLKKRAERLVALSQAMVEQSMRSADWPPKHVAAWCESWCGVHIEMSQWSRNCSSDWCLLDDLMRDMEKGTFAAIKSMTRKINHHLAYCDNFAA